MSGSFNWNPIYDRRLVPRSRDKDRIVGQVILGFLAFSAVYFMIGVIKAILA